MSFFFQEPCFLSKWKIKVELNLSNYPKKSDSKEATDIDTEKLAQKSDLSTLKSDVDDFFSHKFKTVPVDLSN